MNSKPTVPMCINANRLFTLNPHISRFTIFYFSIREMFFEIRSIAQVSLMQRLAMVIYIFCVLNLMGCNVKPTVRQIADSVQINNEWIEIRPIPPLEVSEQVQRISVEMPDTTNWDIRPETGSFVMPTGAEVKIEVELIAIDGSRFMLQSVGISSGLTFSYLPKELSPTASRLPQNMKFASVRFRSNQPIQGGSVNWICITNY